MSADLEQVTTLQPFTDSSGLVDQPDRLRDNLERDGYLFLPGLLPRDAITSVFNDFANILVEAGVASREGKEQQLKPACRPFREGDADYFSVHDQLYKVEAFHALAHHADLLRVMEIIQGPGCFPHPLSIIRMVFPEHTPATTPPHQDFPNNQGSTKLTAAWIPLMACPAELGPLRVLQGSHRLGVLPLQYHLGPGNRAAKLPESASALAWHCSDFAVGDVLLFGAMTVHAACHNLKPDWLRLSVDFRFQPAGEPLTPICLSPHFERLSWDDVYRDWSSDRLKYYWQKNKYVTVDWDESLHALSDEDAEEGLRMALEYAAHRGEVTIDLSEKRKG
jgi:ectoine hydroxylase-related dioxygenase (phytanoyl-CoA dioxygenase family)